jgi:hypothetical protein
MNILLSINQPLASPIFLCRLAFSLVSKFAELLVQLSSFDACCLILRYDAAHGVLVSHVTLPIKTDLFARQRTIYIKQLSFEACKCLYLFPPEMSERHLFVPTFHRDNFIKQNSSKIQKRFYVFWHKQRTTKTLGITAEKVNCSNRQDSLGEPQNKVAHKNLSSQNHVNTCTNSHWSYSFGQRY